MPRWPIFFLAAACAGEQAPSSELLERGESPADDPPEEEPPPSPDTAAQLEAFYALHGGQDAFPERG